MRFQVEPRDIPEEIAARRLGLSLEEFREKLSALLQRGFPAPDETTGRYCLEAIDQWRLRRFPHLFPAPAFEGPKIDRKIARSNSQHVIHGNGHGQTSIPRCDQTLLVLADDAAHESGRLQGSRTRQE
jgi:hypothetical protein